MEEIMIKAHRAGNVALFNHAASAWNHNFFFRCLSPTGGGQPEVDLLAQIDKDFGSLDRLKGEVISKTPARNSRFITIFVSRLDPRCACVDSRLIWFCT